MVPISAVSPSPRSIIRELRELLGPLDPRDPLVISPVRTAEEYKEPQPLPIKRQ